ncbi:MAG: glycosyltransferase family 87 protein [Gemmataceae bacterium]
MTDRHRAWLRRVALLSAWAVCFGYLGQRFYHARTEFDDKPDTPADRRRADGNSGHAQIDFGGQWVMARTVVTGHGRELYHRQRQWQVVRAGYPDAATSEFARRHMEPGQTRPSDVPLSDTRTDTVNLMDWFMGQDSPAWSHVATAVGLPLMSSDPVAESVLMAEAERQVTPDVVTAVSHPAVGGPLYPPVHALLYSPLGLLAPQDAYLAFQSVSLALTLLAGLGASRLTGGRVWWPVATLGILLFPGYRAGLDLGQNHALSLCVLVWGWVLAVRGREWAGGAVWGLLAFKPVWAAAFFLVPLVFGRWRFCLAMTGTGAALGLLTLPVVGVQAWFDWLAVGREASALYGVNRNWVHFSRDLFGLPCRVLIDFNLPESARDNPAVAVIGWATWTTVLVATATLVRLRADRARLVGLGAGFALLGAFLCCYRFMYYDATLAFLAMAVLMGDPRPGCGGRSPASWRRFTGTRTSGCTSSGRTPSPWTRSCS